MVKYTTPFSGSTESINLSGTGIGLTALTNSMDNVANEGAEANRLKRIELQILVILHQLNNLKDDTSKQILTEKLMFLSKEASDDKA